jgi:hypothetical protein
MVNDVGPNSRIRSTISTVLPPESNAIPFTPDHSIEARCSFAVNPTARRIRKNYTKCRNRR